MTDSQYVKELRMLLKQGYSQTNTKCLETGPKRACAILVGKAGGMFGAMSTKLFSRISSDSEIAATARETDRILDQLGERTSALDRNQKRIHILVERIQYNKWEII